MNEYWAESVAEELTQGDLIQDSWIGTTTSPRIGLVKRTGKAGATTWLESAWTPSSDGIGYFLSRGKLIQSIVISYSCELDKQGGKTPVLLAPLFPFSVLQTEQMKEHVRSGSRYAFFPLPAIVGVMEESYVDLRSIINIPRAVVDECKRQRSATEDGIQRLSVQVAAFFTRIDISKIQDMNDHATS